MHEIVPDSQTDSRPGEVEILPALPAHRNPTLALAPDAPVSEWHHNFNLSTFAGKAALLNAANVPDWIPSDGETCQLQVVNYLVYPGEYTDRQTGEIVHATACVLVGKDGRTVRFYNDWSLRRLHAAMLLFTAKDWLIGVPIEVYAKKSPRSGKVYGSFKVLTQAKS